MLVPGTSRVSWIVCSSGLAVLLSLASAAAQPVKVHHLYRADDPPGAIGHRQLLRGQLCYGQTPWMQLVVPRGVIISAAQDGAFADYDATISVFGLPCGQVYRFRLRNIPGWEDVELFPSIEVIDRISPPPGYEHCFPIPIAFDEEDLRAAAGGAMVVRVVALEDPQYPVLLDQAATASQEAFDVDGREDPLHVADELGRPLAIIRLGAARPLSDPPDPCFCFGFPPLDVTVLTDGPFRRTHVAVLDARHPDACREQWQVRPDEVICDGGDEGPRARISSSNMGKGLEPTETVASFRTTSGDRGYAASNRTCLYAPRFFATRKITPIEQQEVVMQPAGMDALTPIAGPSRTIASALAQSRFAAHQRVSNKLRHSLQDAQPGLLVDNLIHPEEARDQQLPYEADQTLSSLFAATTVAIDTSQSMQPAVEWTRVQAAQIVLDDRVAFEQKSVRAANEGVVYESQPGARLQLLKSIACVEPSSDRVQFTIRFDNVGTETLQEVVINDLLSPRLELIEGSSQCSVPAEVATEQHASGALNVQWRLTEPLPAGSGGTIQFQCRVR